jgi:hypothetical protein
MRQSFEVAPPRQERSPPLQDLPLPLQSRLKTMPDSATSIHTFKPFVSNLAGAGAHIRQDYGNAV